MAQNLDQLLSSLNVAGSPPAAPAFRAALARGVTKRDWRRDALMVVAAVFGLVTLAGVALVSSGNTSSEHVAHRAGLLVALAAVCGVGAWAAFAPRSNTKLWLGLGASVLGLAAIVALRGEGAPSASPGWVCSVSHLGLSALPFALMLLQLRHAAITRLRAGVAGLTVGTAGAMLGELACAQSFAHVAAYHVPAWLLAGAAGVVLSQVLRPRSFAP